MVIESLGVKEGVFVAGLGVELAPDGVHLHGDLGGGAFLGPLEDQMLQEMRNAVFVGGLVSGAHVDPYSQGDGVQVGDLFRDEADAVVQAAPLDILMDDFQMKTFPFRQKNRGI